MEIGVFVENTRTVDGSADLDAYIARVQEVAAAGISSVWSPQIFGFDALTALAIAGREVPSVRLGTAVVPTYPRHPMVLAQSALTTSFACGGRLTLGIGLSHQVVVENMWGYSFDKPARHMEEYLSALLPILRGEAVNVRGATVTAAGQLQVPPGTDVPVVVAALGPKMLALAGSTTAGTVTWMTGPETIGSHIAPLLRQAADAAGRGAPRVVCALPVCVTDDAGAARAKAAQAFRNYGYLPSYRAMLDREGAAGPADVAIVGDAATVKAAIAQVFEKGATEFVAVPFDHVEATTETVAELV